MANLAPEDKFLKRVPEDGTSIGNNSLQKKLGWSWNRYWEVRDKLKNENKIGTGRGKGGSVFRIDVTVPINDTNEIKKMEQSFRKEKDLYKPFFDYLSDKFHKVKGIDKSFCKITGDSGKRRGGGTFSRPDLTLITLERFRFILPHEYLTIITFELKHNSYPNFLTGVYETAAHQRYANKSYYVIHLKPDWNESDEREEVEAECSRFGIGLIYIEDPNNCETYEIVIEPEFKTPAPIDMEDFIKRVFKEDEKERILKL
jgi:hypothetical protein